VGGAERNARKKRQAAQTVGQSTSVVAAHKGPDRKGPDRKRLLVGGAVVVVLALAVVGGLLIYNNQKNATEGKDIKAAPGSSRQTEAAAPPAYAVERDGGTVVVGSADAEVTLDVYEDFLCPACRQFEETFGADLEKHVTDGAVRVRYHLLPMLNERSDPPGYSMDSANAGLCAADAGQFPAFHKSLFGDQPEEGNRGWDRRQLAKLGTDLGITGEDFTACVTGGTHNELVQKNFDDVKAATYLQQEFPDGSKGFGTPTLAVGEKVVDTAKGDWLDQLVKSGA
jgi:protein-disulfide isomerase